jgi:hypothetical protein
MDPNRTKQNCLVLLGFIRPNRDFSTGYGESKQEKRLMSQVVRKTPQAHFSSPVHYDRQGRHPFRETDHNSIKF